MPARTQATGMIVERTTAAFRRDRDRLSPADQSRVQDSLKSAYAMLGENRPAFFSKVYQPLQIQLKGGLGSSLYVLRVNPAIRLILTVDDDPVFGQTLFTLFRIVRHPELGRALRSVAQTIYGDQLERRNGAA